jgi:hypothetical protein
MNVASSLIRRSASRRLVSYQFPMAAVAGSASCLLVVAAMLVEVTAGAQAEEESDRRRLADEEGWKEASTPLPADATLEQVVEKIRRARQVTSHFVGYGADVSPVYEAFVRLDQLADEAELRALVDDESPAVRVYAFYALSGRQPGGVAYQALVAHAGDHALVSTMRGCIIDRSTVFAAMLYEVEHLLSPAQLTKLGELKKGAWPARRASSVPAGPLPVPRRCGIDAIEPCTP